MPLNETRVLLTLEDQELEQLVKKWISSRIADNAIYVGFDRPSASADMGRDAVGFLSHMRYEGEWHNYQCKQLKQPLGIANFTLELGKIFYYASSGQFVAPARYVFVSPNGIVRSVQDLVGKPSTIGDFLCKNWDKYCDDKISSVNSTPLTDEIKSAILQYDFSNVEAWNIDHLIELPGFRTLMYEHIDIDPGIAPTVTLADVPSTVGSDEQPYVRQLLAVFSEHNCTEFLDYERLMLDENYGPQMTNSRRRFLEHRAFSLHFRENMPEGTVNQLNTDIRDHIYELHCSTTGYQRLIGVISQAGTTDVSGPLGKHKRVTIAVKQGACHFLANEGDLPWA